MHTSPFTSTPTFRIVTPYPLSAKQYQSSSYIVWLCTLPNNMGKKIILFLYQRLI